MLHLVCHAANFLASTGSASLCPFDLISEVESSASLCPSCMLHFTQLLDYSRTSISRVSPLLVLHVQMWDSRHAGMA